MIPDDLDALLRSAGSPRSDLPVAFEQELSKLGIAPDSQLAQIAQRYNLALLADEGPSFQELEDPFWPEGSMLSAARFVRETWELPEKFVPISSCEGEGCYLYDKDSGEVWDFELASRTDFLIGMRQPMFRNFFDFMRWYLGAADAPQLR